MIIIIISRAKEKAYLIGRLCRFIGQLNKSINKNGVIRQVRKSMCPAVPPIKISGKMDKPNNKTKIRSILNSPSCSQRGEQSPYNSIIIKPIS